VGIRHGASALRRRSRTRRQPARRCR
jgi:hypothetical protein